LDRLEKQYFDRKQSYNNRLTIEDRISQFQARIEDKIKSEYQRKLDEYKASDRAHIHSEEREKLRSAHETARSDLERMYKERAHKINEHERQFNDMTKQRRESADQEIFMQRQLILDEIKRLREKEIIFQEHRESQMRLQEEDTYKLNKREEDLEKREFRLKQMENELASRFRDERQRITLDVERTYAQREFQLESVEQLNRQQAESNKNELEHLERLKKEFQAEQRRTIELELAMQKAQGEAMCLSQENELIKQKLKHCMDYDFIKEENRTLRHKLNLSKEIIGEKSRQSQLGFTPRSNILCKEIKCLISNYFILILVSL
jgi:hypothetical protein